VQVGLMQGLENQFGNYTIAKKYPDIIDTSRNSSRYYTMKFETYNNVDSIINYFDTSTEILRIDFLDNTFKNITIPNDPSFQFGKLTTDGTSGYFYDEGGYHTYCPFIYHQTSLQWNLMAISIPIAWEITMGKSDIVIGVYGSWGGQDYTVLEDTQHGLYNSEDLYYYCSGEACNQYESSSEFTTVR